MKTSLDPRHVRRQKLIQELFEWNEKHVNFPENALISERIKPILDNLKIIDVIISKHAPEWEVDKIYHVDLAILRLAVYEIKIDKSQPEKAVIDEAIELAKEFGNETSPSFINGVLGGVIKET